MTVITILNTVYFSVHYLSVFHTVQGLFQDFASEGANAKFQILGGGGKYKFKGGQPHIKRTEKPIPRGGKRIPRGGGQKHPLAPLK